MSKRGKVFYSLLLVLFLANITAAWAINGTVAPNSLDYGTRALNRYTSRHFTISNNGTQSVYFGGVSLSGSSAFAVSVWSGPKWLEPGGSVAVWVRFTPTAATSYSANLTATFKDSTGSRSQSVGLIGAGASSGGKSSPSGQLVITPSSLTFGNQTVNTTVSRNFSVTNVGSGSVSLTSIASASNAFAVTGWSGATTLASGTTQTFAVSFTPTTTAGYTGSVAIQSNASNQPALNISGSGVASSAPSPVGVTVQPATLSLPAGGTQEFAATVTNTPDTSVSWQVNSLVGGNASVGTISQAGFYTAPPSVPSNPYVTITAVSAADSTKKSSSAVSITATASTGNDYYVSPTGSDSASGALAAPWRTIGHSISVVRPGDTVHVLPGSYNESPYCTRSGTSTAPIRFVSEQKWAAKILGSGSENWGFRVDGDYNSIEGFDITNSNTSSGHEGVETNGNFDQVMGNNIHNIDPNGGSDGLGGAGIVNGGDITKGNLDVIGNVVHDIGNINFPWYQVQGIYYGSKGGRIYNNIVYRVQGWGIHLWHAASNITIANNTVFNNMEGGIIVGDGDYPCPNACATDDYTIVTNNIVVYNQAHNYNGSVMGGYGISENGHTGTHNVYANNLVYGNAAGGYLLQNGLTATGTVEADPQLLNYQANGSGNYQLGPSKSCN